MLIRPIPAPRRARSRVRDRSRLSATILRMIGSNSLAAFAQVISRSSAAQPVRGVQGTTGQPQLLIRVGTPAPNGHHVEPTARRLVTEVLKFRK